MRTTVGAGTGAITSSADANDFDPNKKLVITVTSPNNWKLVDASNSRNTDTISYTLKNNSTDTSATTSWEIPASDLTRDGGTTITFGAQVEDFSTKRPGAYEDPVTFSVEVQ